MDIPTIATAAVSFLAPALPYLAKAGEKGSEIIGEKLGASVWEKVSALWRKLGPAVEANPLANDALQEVAHNPEDADAQATLRLQLKKILAADDNLASEVMRLLLEASVQQVSQQAAVFGEGAIAQGPGAVAAGKGGVAVGGDVHGGVRIGGTEFIGTQIKRES